MKRLEDGGRDWRGVQLFSAALDHGYVALELLHAEDEAFVGEEVVVPMSRISADTWPENQALIKPYL